MFSPPRLLIPAASARSQGVAPLGSVRSKKPCAAMAWLNDSARSASAPSAVSAVQPALARLALTSRSTSASAVVACPDAAAGGAAGRSVAVREGDAPWRPFLPALPVRAPAPGPCPAHPFSVLTSGVPCAFTGETAGVQGFME
ncbi:hypothetical protein SFUMM280S_09612 [Streptomyces fumanus]